MRLCTRTMCSKKNKTASKLCSVHRPLHRRQKQQAGSLTGLSTRSYRTGKTRGYQTKAWKHFPTQQFTAKSERKVFPRDMDGVVGLHHIHAFRFLCVSGPIPLPLSCALHQSSQCCLTGNIHSSRQDDRHHRRSSREHDRGTRFVGKRCRSPTTKGARACFINVALIFVNAR